MNLYNFGSFTLCADQKVLELDGRAVPLTPKMFETLLLLVRNPGRILEKEKILSEVWPDSFVEEGNIAFNIRQIRKALGDDAQSPTYIETVPKRGYRFIAEIGNPSFEESEESQNPVEESGSARHHRKFRYIGIISLFCLSALFIAAAGYRFVAPRSIAPILSNEFVSDNLSTDGNVYHAVISPDGKNMVYTHRSRGKQSLWLRQLETQSNTQILPTSDLFYGGLGISPDGETVFFARGSQTGPQMDVYKMPVAGGVPQKVIESTQGWISLSSDAKRLSFVRCPYTATEHCALYTADATDGGNEKKLATRPGPIRIGDNKISPDGRKVTFAAGQSRTSSNEFRLLEVDIETGVERAIVEEKFFNIKYISWLPDGENVLFTAMRLPDRNFAIWQASAKTGELKKLTTDAENYSRLSLDAKANLLLSTTVRPDFQLSVGSVGGTGDAVNSLANAMTVAFAPDGKIVYSSLMTGDSEIWSTNPDGSDQRQLTSNPAADTAPIVSPDNRFIYFTSDRAGVIQLWRMGSDGSDQEQITQQEGGYALAVSPDGRWLYYRSGLNNTLRRVNTETKVEELAMKETGKYLVVSPDTRSVAYAEKKDQTNTISIYSLTDAKITKTFTVSQPNTRLAQLAWSANGREIAYVLTDDKRENGKIYIQPLDGGGAKQIADLTGDTIAEMSAVALSHDGKSFAVVKGRWEHNAVLIKGLK